MALQALFINTRQMAYALPCKQPFFSLRIGVMLAADFLRWCKYEKNLSESSVRKAYKRKSDAASLAYIKSTWPMEIIVAQAQG